VAGFCNMARLLEIRFDGPESTEKASAGACVMRAVFRPVWQNMLS
jgi:hypothetical protein